MSDSEYTHRLGQFRITVQDGDDRIQWRSPFTDKESAEAQLEDADKEFAEAQIETLFGTDPDQNGVVDSAEWRAI